MSWHRKFMLAIAVAASGGMVVAYSVARAADDDKPSKAGQEKNGDAKKADEKKAEEPKAEEEADLYAVPKDADAKALVEYIEKLQRFRPKTRDEAINHLTKMPAAVREAAAKVMELEKDKKDSELLKKARYALLVMQARELAGMKPADQKKAIDDAKEYLANLKELRGEDAVLAMIYSQQLEFSGKTDLAKEAMQAFSDIIAKHPTKDERVKQITEAMAGSLRRMNLIGNQIEIKGKMVDGKDFDWAAYSKGKVVLIDFWATWCGPCRAELPNVKKNYDKYHEKGFDVVGISLDTERDKLEAYLEKEGLPWAQLYEEGAGWQHPVAKYYGIQGIPTVILVDKDGKVVSLAARGPELGKLLEKLLGPAEEKKEDKAGGGE